MMIINMLQNVDVNDAVKAIVGRHLGQSTHKNLASFKRPAPRNPLSQGSVGFKADPPTLPSVKINLRV